MSSGQEPARTGYWVADHYLDRAAGAREAAARFPRTSEAAETLLTQAVDQEEMAARLQESHEHMNAVAAAIFGWSR